LTHKKPFLAWFKNVLLKHILWCYDDVAYIDTHLIIRKVHDALADSDNHKDL